MAIIEEDNRKPKHGPAVYAILYTGAIAKLLFSYYRVDPEKSLNPADLADLLVPEYGDAAFDELDGTMIKAGNESRLKVVYNAVLTMCAKELVKNDSFCSTRPYTTGVVSAEALNIAATAPPPLIELKHLLTFLEEAIDRAFDWARCQRYVHKNGAWKQAMQQLCEAANSSRNSATRSNSPNVQRVRDVTKTFGMIFELVMGREELRNMQVELGLGDMTAALRAAAIGRSVEKQLKDDHTTGGFFVYRRARSSITNRIHDIDLIVRDFVWLLPGFSSTEDADRGVHGYYFSAFDEEVYEITNRPSVADRRELLKIDAVARRTKGPDKHLSLYAPNIPFHAADGFTLGTIVGSLRDTQRTGGWTCVLLRPDLEPREIYALNSVAYSFHKLLSPIPKTYGTEIDRFRDTMQVASLVGVFTSRLLESVNDPSVPITPDSADLRRSDLMACFCYCRVAL
ncbi:hypothetical protein ACSQ76_22115 [Roseovarius sp. B08]|uniref:hypothetical protein n=1 Tax=Roseovarius sp. B08 TaxID=3449223 RepID=UPI003EDC6BBF